jgi:hypothetical protein
MAGLDPAISFGADAELDPGLGRGDEQNKARYFHRHTGEDRKSSDEVLGPEF